MTQTPRRWAAGLLAIALIVAACGSNDPDAGASGAVGGATGEPAPASQAPALESAEVSGELTVWAMGNEGALLSELVPGFEEAYPGVTVNLTPVDWDQAVNKLQTAIGGRQTPDVSQLGTDMMGQFAQTGALEAVPAELRPGHLLRERLEHRRRRRRGLRRPVVRRDPRPSTSAPTSPRRPA